MHINSHTHTPKFLHVIIICLTWQGDCGCWLWKRCCSSSVIAENSISLCVCASLAIATTRLTDSLTNCLNGLFSSKPKNYRSKNHHCENGWSPSWNFHFNSCVGGFISRPPATMTPLNLCTLASPSANRTPIQYEEPKSHKGETLYFPHIAKLMAQVAQIFPAQQLTGDEGHPRVNPKFCHQRPTDRPAIKGRAAKAVGHCLQRFLNVFVVVFTVCWTSFSMGFHV